MLIWMIFYTNSHHGFDTGSYCQGQVDSSRIAKICVRAINVHELPGLGWYFTHNTGDFVAGGGVGVFVPIRTCVVHAVWLHNRPSCPGFQGHSIQLALAHTTQERKSNVHISSIGVCFFSSPEPKARVSYCHSAPSVVRPSPSSSVRKLFTFSTSSPKPTDGFRWNLVGMKYSWSLTSVVVLRPDAPRGGSRAGPK